MMWFHLSIAAMFCAAIYTLAITWLRKSGLSGSTTLGYVWSFALLWYFIWVVLVENHWILTKIEYLVLAVACVLSFLGNKAGIEALHHAPNAGYVTAVKSLQSILVAIGAVVFFVDQELTLIGLSGIVMIGLGVASLGREQSESDQQLIGILSRFPIWLRYTLFAVICFSVMLLLFKRLTGTIAPTVFLMYLFAVVTPSYLISAARKRQLRKVSLKELLVVLLGSVASFAANALSVTAYRPGMAPNAGYVAAIFSAQMIIVMFVAPLTITGQSLHRRGVLAVVSVLIGVVLLSVQ